MITVTHTRRFLCFTWTRTTLVPVAAPATSEREWEYHQSNALGR